MQGTIPRPSKTDPSKRALFRDDHLFNSGHTTQLGGLRLSTGITNVDLHQMVEITAMVRDRPEGAPRPLRDGEYHIQLENGTRLN